MILKINYTHTGGIGPVKVLSKYEPSSTWAENEFDEVGYYYANKYIYIDTERLAMHPGIHQIKNKALKILNKEKINKYIKKLAD